MTRRNANRWVRILPVVFITYSLAFLDRVNFSFASASGMDRDLGISKGMSALISALFFLGYFFFQVPGAALAQRRNVRRLIFFSLLAWGILAPLAGILRDPHGLLAVRFVLGMTEAAVLPSLVIYLSHWFTRRERSRANTLMILGNPVTVLWMSVVSGYLIRVVGWRGMFIAEGAPALVWAFVWWLATSERPADAAWMSDGEKADLAATLAGEQEGLRPYRNYRAAFATPAVILMCVQYFAWSIGVYGFILWLPSILRQASGLGIVATGWLSAGPYLLAAAAEFAVASWSDRALERKSFVWICLFVAAAAFYGSHLAGAGHFWLSYVLLALAGPAMYAPYGPFFAWVYELLPENVAGGAFALINSMGALGSFIGSFGVGLLNGRTGNPDAAFIALAASLAIAAAATVLIRPTERGARRWRAEGES